MVAFSKFLTGQLAPDNFLTTMDTPTTFGRIRRLSMAALTGDAPRTVVRSALASSTSIQLTDPSLLDLRGTLHNHDTVPLLEQKKEIVTSLKRKAADQQLSSTQNIITETLSSCSAELNVALPKMEFLARVAQRSRAKSSGSVNHPEAPLCDIDSGIIMLDFERACLNSSHS